MNKDCSAEQYGNHNQDDPTSAHLRIRHDEENGRHEEGFSLQKLAILDLFYLIVSVLIKLIAHHCDEQSTIVLLSVVGCNQKAEKVEKCGQPADNRHKETNGGSLEAAGLDGGRWGLLNCSICCHVSIDWDLTVLLVLAFLLVVMGKFHPDFFSFSAI